MSLALYLLIFGRGLDNYFVGDDWAFLDEISRVHTVSDIAGFFSFGTALLVRPLEKIITWLLYSGFGLNFLVFHGSSLFLDVANTLWLGVLAFLLFISEQQADVQAVRWAIVVSLLFAFNWTHHEAVFWYSAINEPLTAFFRLTGIFLFVWLLPRREVPSWVTGTAIVALALLALFAKESAVVFPVELFLFFFYFRVIHPKGQIHRADVVVLVLVSLVVLGWLLLYRTGAPAGVIETGRGGVKLTLGSMQDWLLRIPRVFNSTVLGLDGLSANLIGVELVAAVGFVALAILRRRFVWVLALVWTIVLMLPYAALFSSDEMMAFLLYTSLPMPDRYFYLFTAASGLLLVTGVMWVWQEIDNYIPSRLIRVGGQALLCVVLVTLLALNLQKLLAAENDWDISGQTVLRLSRQLEPVVTQLKSGDTLCLANLPDNYRFKWTFRNATQGVLYLTYKRADYGILAMTDEAEPISMDHCTVHLRYDPTSQNFISE